MSRRSQRHQPKLSSNPPYNLWIVNLLKYGAALIIILIIASVIMLRQYLRSADFLNQANDKIDHALKLKGELKPIHWTGFSIQAEGYEGVGNETVQSLSLRQLDTHFNLASVLNPKIAIKQTEIKEVDITLNLDAKKTSAQVAPSTSPAIEPSAPSKNKSKQTRVELDQVLVKHLNLKVLSKKNQLSLSGAHLNIQFPKPFNPKKFNITGANGSLNFNHPKLQNVQLQDIELTKNQDFIFLKSLHAKVDHRASIHAFGEWNNETKAGIIQGEVSDIPLESYIKENWKQKLTGKANGTFHYLQSKEKKSITGSVELIQTQLTAIPLLDMLSVYLNTQRLRQLNLDEARADYVYEDGVLQLNHIQLAANGLLRVEGSLQIQNQHLSGTVQCGLAPNIYKLIPATERHLFQLGNHNMYWASINLSGTLEDPKEDFSRKMLVVAGLRILKDLPQYKNEILQITGKIIGDEPQQIIEKGIEQGIEALQENPKIIRKAEGLLNKILGGKTEEPTQSNKPNPPPSNNPPPP